MIKLTGILFASFALDFIIGDPYYRFHPVRIIGFGVSFFEKTLRKIGCNGRWGGIFLVTVIVIFFLALYLLTSLVFYGIYPPLGLCFDIFICYSCLALKDLIVHVRDVLRALEAAELSEARKKISRVVGRKATCLDERGISRAAIETLAENFVDGFLSPVCWYVAGAVLAVLSGPFQANMAVGIMFVYKMINTLDSMVGHRNEKYLRFGWAGARIDDVMNFIPARLSLFVLFAGTLFSSSHPVKGLKVALRDRLKHDSPNSAHAESFFAGALDIRLGGPTAYNDGYHNRPWLGAGSPDPSVMDIQRAICIIRYSGYVTAALAVASICVTASLFVK